MIYLIMGVSGSGKTTVGTSLSKTFSVPFKTYLVNLIIGGIH